MDKKIKINYLPSLDINFLEHVAEERFPECKVKVQTWGVNSPFVIIRKGFLLEQ